MRKRFCLLWLPQQVWHVWYLLSRLQYGFSNSPEAEKTGETVVLQKKMEAMAQGLQVLAYTWCMLPRGLACFRKEFSREDTTTACLHWVSLRHVQDIRIWFLFKKVLRIEKTSTWPSTAAKRKRVGTTSWPKTRVSTQNLKFSERTVHSTQKNLPRQQCPPNQAYLAKTRNPPSIPQTLHKGMPWSQFYKTKHPSQ